MTQSSPHLLQQRVEAVFAADGVLSDLPGYAPRSEQQAMAQAVAEAIIQKEVLLVEAPTGTGKTFAYLAPAILSGQRIIISTGSKNLQDQLYTMDLPRMVAAIKQTVRTALLKGRNNYLCLYRMKKHLDDSRPVPWEIRPQLQEIEKWQHRTLSGEISDLAKFSEDALIWPYVTSTRDNCLGQTCPMLEQCFLVKARRQAQAAEVVIVNHALLCADFSLKDEGMGAILPDADVVIIDEAHQFPEVASQYFGTSLSSHQLRLLIADIETEYEQAARDMQALVARTSALESAWQDFRVSLGVEAMKAPWQDVAHHEEVQTAIVAVNVAWVDLITVLDAAKTRTKGLENAWSRAQGLAAQFALLTGPTPTDVIHWYETFKQAVSLHFTPFELAELFNKHLYKPEQTWIFTSATLSVEKNLGYFKEKLGLMNTRDVCLDTPFDYYRQAVLYVPRGLPRPNQAHFLKSWLSIAQRLINVCEGRTLILFTSHKALQEAKLLLADCRYPLLVQGQAAKHDLLRQFREQHHAVLMGTYSFWEGIDLKGDMLRCVIIDKLPFFSPADPTTQAKIQLLTERGKDAFMEYQIPHAVIALKQGAGRLIRDIQDKGVLMIADPRMAQSSFASIFLRSLPFTRRTRNLERVLQFLLMLGELKS